MRCVRSPKRGSVACPLPQVGFVTVICATCFTVRAVIVAWSALDKQDADLDVWQHPLLDIIYYSLVCLIAEQSHDLHAPLPSSCM